jgi:hypothetical protein
VIAKLTGVLDSTGSDWAVVDVAGVGYLLFCSARTLAMLPGIGKAVSLMVETHVREDHIHLYGFADAADREWFRLLTTVQGVGSRVALAVQSVLSATDLVQAILAQDKTGLIRANGVGPKLASPSPRRRRRWPPPARSTPAARWPTRSPPWSISAIAAPRRSAPSPTPPSRSVPTPESRR